MKLQRFNKYVAAIMVSFIAISTNSCSLNLEKEEMVVETSVEEKDTQEERITITHNFNIPSNDKIAEDILSLGDVQSDKAISKTYKVLEFADKNQYYRVMVVGARVDYVVDESGNVIGNKYTFFDMFTKQDLFSTSNFKTFDDVQAISELFDQASILSCNSIDQLANIAKNFGATDEYIELVMNRDQMINDMDAAKMYVSLIPDSNRVNLFDLGYSECKKID